MYTLLPTKKREGITVAKLLWYRWELHDDTFQSVAARGSCNSPGAMAYHGWAKHETEFWWRAKSPKCCWHHLVSSSNNEYLCNLYTCKRLREDKKQKHAKASPWKDGHGTWRSEPVQHHIAGIFDYTGEASHATRKQKLVRNNPSCLSSSHQISPWLLNSPSPRKLLQAYLLFSEINHMYRYRLLALSDLGA